MPSLLVAAPVHTLSVVVMVAIPSSSCPGAYTQRGGYGVPSLLVAARCIHSAWWLWCTIPSSSCPGAYTQRGGYGVPSLLVAAPVHTLSVVVMVCHPF